MSQLQALKNNRKGDGKSNSAICLVDTEAQETKKLQKLQPEAVETAVQYHIRYVIF